MDIQKRKAERKKQNKTKQSNDRKYVIEEKVNWLKSTSEENKMYNGRKMNVKHREKIDEKDLVGK